MTGCCILSLAVQEQVSVSVAHLARRGKPDRIIFCSFTGPDAVRELFGAAGPQLGWAARASKLPGFAELFGLLYKFLARYRYPISDAVVKTKKAVRK